MDPVLLTGEQSLTLAEIKFEFGGATGTRNHDYFPPVGGAMDKSRKIRPDRNNNLEIEGKCMILSVPSMIYFSKSTIEIRCQ